MAPQDTAVSRPTSNQLLHGRDVPPEPVHVLRAGPVTALLEGADLRTVRMGTTELVQRVYVAVRDEVWNTIPGEYSDWQIDAHDDRFEVRFSARHRYADIDYTWKATIKGEPDGSISYAMDGVAHGSFRYAKIGLNVHHALPTSVGQAYRAWTPDGEISGTLPTLIEPQRLEQGRLTALFPEYDRLQLSLPGGGAVDFRFEGDLFEMQDHRNWTDANFKSYGTPLSVPWPMDAGEGQQFHQRVVIRPEGVAASPAGGGTGARVTVGGSAGRGLPAFGFGLPSDRGRLSPREVELLRALRADHLRADVYMDDADWRAQLDEGRAACRALGSRLELAVFAPPDHLDLLGELAAELAADPVAVARVLVFAGGRGFAIGGGSTPGAMVREARARLRPVLPGVPVAGGTNLFFVELNRDHPDAEAMDGVVYSLNPQVHAADDRSLMENVKGQEDTVTTLRSFVPRGDVLVSPVTLIGRAGPFPGGPPVQGGLPGNVDTRQMSLFGAAWTVGTVRHLAESAVASVTWYEAAGWCGLVERDGGAAHPDYPSVPGMVFPVYDLFAFLAGHADAELAEVSTTPWDEVEACAVRIGGALHVMVANLTAQAQRVRVDGIAGARVRVTQLDGGTVAADLLASRLTAASESEVRDGALHVDLAPYAVGFISEQGR